MLLSWTSDFTLNKSVLQDTLSYAFLPEILILNLIFPVWFHRQIQVVRQLSSQVRARAVSFRYPSRQVPYLAQSVLLGRQPWPSDSAAAKWRTFHEASSIHFQSVEPWMTRQNANQTCSVINKMFNKQHKPSKPWLLLRQLYPMPITFTQISGVNMEPIVLTLGQKFELERRSRDISAISDVQELQAISKDLLRAWQEEIARSRAAVRSACGGDTPWNAISHEPLLRFGQSHRDQCSFRSLSSSKLSRSSARSMKPMILSNSKGLLVIWPIFTSVRGLLQPGSSQSANDSNRVFCFIPLPGLFQIGAE